MKPAVEQLKLGHATGSVPKHSRKSATECLKKNKGVAMTQSPALILIEMLWQDVKRATSTHKHQLTQTEVIKRKRSKIPPQQCERLIKPQRK